MSQFIFYCIICGKCIPRDTNKPFCNKCFSSFQNAKIAFKKGVYCHYCGEKAQIISNQYPKCKECGEFNRDDNSIDDYYLEKVMEFRNMSLSERQNIKPIWLYEEKGFKLNIVLKELEITEVLGIIKSASNLNIDDVFQNEPKNNRRIMNILRAWKKGIEIPPPSIVFKDRIVFQQGRHRTLSAHFIGAKTIPVYCIDIKQ